MSVQSFLNNFVDKVVLVTGGGAGIGRAVCTAFAEHGAKVIVCDVNDDEAQETLLRIQDRCSGRGHIAIKADVSADAEVEELFKKIRSKYGRLDFAVNCAGVEGERAVLHDSKSDDFRRVLGTNVIGTYLCMKQELDLMLESYRGHVEPPLFAPDADHIKVVPEDLAAVALDFHPAIVNIASTAGLGATPEFSPYGASKAAVISLSRTAAAEYAPQIRINAIAPATTFTPMYERFATRWPDWQAATNASYGAGRIGTPEEIARAAVWLCSRECNFLVGHVLVVDGCQGSKLQSRQWGAPRRSSLDKHDIAQGVEARMVGSRCGQGGVKHAPRVGVVRSRLWGRALPVHVAGCPCTGVRFMS